MLFIKLFKKYKQTLSADLKLKLRNFLNKIIKKKIVKILIGLFWGRNLSILALIYNTDKYGGHYYTPHYRKYFRKLKYKKIKLFEIGVGGAACHDKGGNSLRMWKQYFPFGKIFSIDIYDKSLLEEKRIKIFKGNQNDSNFLNKITNEIGQIDIIIDDGSHVNEHVVNSFKYLFPKLKKGGIYAIEDTQTSYWEEFGGNNENLEAPNTTMNFFKKIADCINYKEFRIDGYVPNYYDKNVLAIHFYHNIIFIFKGDNKE